MKAIILSAGKGERIKKISQSLPKPMLNVNGKPILQHNIELCKRFGIEEIYINTHHLPNVIYNHFGNGKKFGVKIKYSYEDELKGTAGAVKNIAGKFWEKDDFLQFPFFFVIYGDNYTKINLADLKKITQRNDAIAIIALHYREDVSSSGVAELNQYNQIIKFIEKPKKSETTSKWVNAGVYLLKSEILDYIPNTFSDFGADIFPLLLNENLKIYGVKSKEIVLAFDTPELYKKNIN